jgi:glutamate racemase
MGLLRQDTRPGAEHQFLSSGDIAWFADLGRRLFGPELAQAEAWVPPKP